MSPATLKTAVSAPAPPPPPPSDPVGNPALIWGIIGAFVLIGFCIAFFLWGDYRLGATRNQAASYEADKQWVAAAGQIEKLIKMQPGDEAALRQRAGWDLIRAGEYDQGVKQFERAKALNPALNLAKPRMVCYYAVGRDADGDTYREKVLKSNPKDPAANYFLARDLIRQGQYLEAGQKLRLCVTDSEWDEKAVPLRKELVAKVFGDTAATTQSTARAAAGTPATSAIATAAP